MMKRWKQTAAGLLAALLCICAGITGAAGAVYEGVDISVWQGAVDFRQVRASGRDVAYIRAGEGMTEDLRFRENAVNARLAGLKTGFYYFVTAVTEEEARLQAAYFAELIRPYAYDCRPAMDYEVFDGLSDDAVNALAVVFAEELAERTGVTPLFYTDAFRAENLWSGGLVRYPLWVAAYGAENPETGPWREWAGFQYSDQGQVAGVPGRVDLDRYTDAVLLTPAERASAPDTPTRNQTVFRYTVQRGNTLWAISRRFGVTVAALVEENQIQNPNLIYPGQVLRIPDRDVRSFRYEVRRGDTLWAISRRFGVTVAQLVEQNAIQNPDLIYPGQILRIPR